MKGFRFAYRLSGGAPTIQGLSPYQEENLTVNDLVILDAGGIQLGATSDTGFLGAVQVTKKPAKTTEELEVITDADAVYAVEDNNARKIGDTLDLAGATGEQGIAPSNHKEFVVAAPSTAAEPTLVRFNVGKHLNNTAQ